MWTINTNQNFDDMLLWLVWFTHTHRVIVFVQCVCLSVYVTIFKIFHPPLISVPRLREMTPSKRWSLIPPSTTIEEWWPISPCLGGKCIKGTGSCQHTWARCMRSTSWEFWGRTSTLQTDCKSAMSSGALWVWSALLTITMFYWLSTSIA